MERTTSRSQRMAVLGMVVASALLAVGLVNLEIRADSQESIKNETPGIINTDIYPESQNAHIMFG